MIDYLETVLEEAEQIPENHPTVACEADNAVHEYLRFAVLRLLEVAPEDTYTDVEPVEGVTVGYGIDEAMADSWRETVQWWETVPIQEECTRFRIFYSDEYEVAPRTVVDVMAALGAWRVWVGKATDAGAYDHRERREVHHLWPKSHPVENRLSARLGTDQQVAVDGGRTGDIRAREFVDERKQVDGLESRTRRAIQEEMDVSLLEKGGCYEVHSSSGNVYEVDVIAKTCTCLDWQRREPEGGCKHLRRVDQEIKDGCVPRPDGRLPVLSK